MYVRCIPALGYPADEGGYKEELVARKGAKGKRKAGREDGRVKRLLERIHLDAAGIDVGASQHWVAVPTDRAAEPVQHFGVHTGELHRLADWLTACGVDTVAMESTGIYWIPLYEILEERGFELVLANAQHVKNVPGRKSDVLDCQWIQELHTYGLLRGSFRPCGEIVALRSLVRHRTKLGQECAAYIQRMQKALVLMNLQLPRVISDIKGATGMAIIRDIVAGETDPAVLARHRDIRCKASERQIAEALTGHYRPEQVFVLSQNLDMYDCLRAKIAECDLKIEDHIDTLKDQSDPPDEPLPRRRQRRPSANEPSFDVRSPLHRMCGGVDLTQVPGIGPLHALNLIAEIGTDMSRWPTSKHFTAWLTLAPGTKISGGKRLGSRTQPSANRAAAVFRMAAMANGRSDNAIAAHYRRLAFRIGTPKALTASARKLAVIVYNMLKHGRPYQELGTIAYNRKQAARRLRRLAKQAEELGYEVVSKPPNPEAVGVVS
jgi:transposase